MADILDSIFKRRSVRVYERKPVEKEKLVDLLKAAMAAPSASNSRPWEFVVITDEEVLKKMRSGLKYGNYNAPAAVVVLGNTSIAYNESAFRFWVQDCSAAIENLLIAAANMGLGTCWIASYPKEDVINFHRKTLGIPEEAVPLALIYVGYPAEEKKPRTQYDESRVHWEKY
jgi:nitroreductase